MLDDKTILDLAHRTATKYVHSEQPESPTYTFNNFHLLDFARKLLVVANPPQPPQTRLLKNNGKPVKKQ